MAYFEQAFSALRGRASVGGFWVRIALASCVTGCGMPLSAALWPPLTSSAIVTRRVPGNVELQLEGVPDADFCSDSDSLTDLCLRNAKTAISNGLERTLSSFGLSTGGHGGYRAMLRLGEFNHWLEGEGTMHMSIAWQFVLFDEAGRAVVQVGSRTQSPRPMNGEEDFQQSARSMFVAVLDRIADALNGLPATPPSRTPAFAPAASN